MKKVLSLALAIVLIVGLLPIGMMSASAEAETVVFEFGDNGAATHKDGSDMGASKSYTSGDYTLALTNASKCFTGAYDATGKSALKMGTSSTVGSFSMTVPDDVVSVIFKVAKYKAKTTAVNVNGTEYAISTSSDDGAYTDITVDTTATKTISFATVSSKCRCMIDSITYVLGESTGGGSGEGGESGGDEGGEDETPTYTTPAEIMAAANALAAGESLTGTYTLTGVITAINTVYSSAYGNITVTMAVNDTEYSIQCYRMTGTGVDVIKSGDTITVTGTITNNNGTVRFDTGCTLDSYVDGGQEVVIYQTPAEILAAAAELANDVLLSDGHIYTLTGVITSVDSVYSSSYGNVTVTMLVNGTESSIQCYRMTGTGADLIGVGDTITVSGSIKNYNGTIEFDAGCTLDSYTLADDGEGDEGGDEGGDAVEGESESLNITATGGTLASDSLSISWEGTNFSVVNEKGTSSSAIRTSDSDHFRVYKNNSTTISAKNGKQLSQIVITTTGSTYTTALLNSTFSDGVTAAADGNVVTLTLASAMDAVVIDATSAQWRLNKVEVTYAAAGGADESTVEFTGAQVTLGDDLDMAFSVSIPDAQKVDTMQVEFTVDGKTSYAPIGAGVDGVYTFTVELPTKNMTSTISTRLIDGEGTEHATKEYTVRDYAETILNDTTDAYDELEKAAAKAMLNYGAMAQLYFGYNTTDLANSNCAYTEAELNAADVSGVAAIAASNGLESFKGASLVLKSKLAIRLYFTEAVTGSVSTANGHYVEVSGIGAADLDATQTVTVDGATYTFSALSMAKSVIEGESYSANFKNLMKALVLYSAAAEKL